MSQEAYDYPATPPPSTPKRTTQELAAYREQKTIIDAALVSTIYEISKKESPPQDIDPVAHGKWATLNEAQRIGVIKKSQATAVQLLNDLPVADLPAGWKAEDMAYMLQIDASILARGSRILTTIQDAFQQELGTYEGNPQFQTFLEQPARTRFSEDARFDNELEQARKEVTERFVFDEVWSTIQKIAKGDVPYDALKPKWEELDRFGKYDVLHEVELQALKWKIDFSNNPTENLQTTPASKIDLWTLFSRKMGTVIAAYPNIHSTTSSPASTKTVSSDVPPLGIMDMDSD